MNEFELYPGEQQEPLEGFWLAEWKRWIWEEGEGLWGGDQLGGTFNKVWMINSELCDSCLFYVLKTPSIK